jgi:osmoprotectant transport system ATP-binding protein
VTPIDEIDLERPPVVHEMDALADAHAAMVDQGARWAVVLDDQQNLRGWVSIERSADSGSGVVRDRADRMDAWVTKEASLKDALATMLQWDAGWVAVLDGDRFLGVLTPGTLHEALRRSVSAVADGVDLADVEVATTGPLH